jgi:hypothetical protein
MAQVQYLLYLEDPGVNSDVHVFLQQFWQSFTNEWVTEQYPCLDTLSGIVGKASRRFYRTFDLSMMPGIYPTMDNVYVCALWYFMSLEFAKHIIVFHRAILGQSTTISSCSRDYNPSVSRRFILPPDLFAAPSSAA